MAFAGDDSVSGSLSQLEMAAWAHWGLEPRLTHLDRDPPLGRLRLEEVGSGQPVLMVHGTGGYGPYWGPLVAKLDGFRCLMLNRPGWGGSEPVDFSQVPYRNFVADMLVGVLDDLSIDRVHVVGASIGDTWALSLAANHPERVNSVSLLGGGPLVDEVPVPPPIRILRSPLGVLMAKIPWGERMERSQARGSGHGPALEDGRMPQAYVSWAADMTSNSNWRVHERDMVRAVVDRNGWKPGLTFDPADLSTLSVPLLMVFGTADRTAPLETWQTFVSHLPSGHLETVDQGGHWPWFEDPERVAGSLRDHFQSAAS